jgi:DNA-binding GntR family transcriptional regulator
MTELVERGGSDRTETDQAAVRPEAIYQSLRDDILGLHQAPGSFVTESAVALRFGVARPTAKLAIERLVNEGLLRREAHRAAKVPTLSREDIVDLYDIRAVIESEACARVAADGAIPAEALRAHRQLVQQSKVGGPFAANDIRFHRGLVAGQSSPRLAAMHSRLMGEIELCIGQVESYHLQTTNRVVENHQKILDGLMAGDVEGSRELARAHVVQARDRLLAHYDSMHPPVLKKPRRP